MRAQQRLYLTADKAKLVPEGDDDAATLYASPGDEIPDSAAELFGLVDGALPDGAGAAARKQEGKPVKEVDENKGDKAGATKEAAGSGGKGADAGGTVEGVGGTPGAPAGGAAE